MKRMALMMMLALATGLGASAQDIGGIISAGVTTVIRAVDLQIQRIQTKTIVLQEAQKAVENAMSALELDDIRNWVERQKDLYAGYFSELWQVKTVISGYHRVSEAMRRQEAIVAAYRRGLGQFRQDGHFSAEELNEIEAVFDGILADSEKNLEQLTKAVAAFSLQATDQQRMAMIDAAADGMDRNYRDLQRYTEQNQLLSLQRAKDGNDYSFILKLYGQ